MKILPLTAILLALGAAPAVAATPTGAPVAVIKANQARFGGGRGFGRSTYRSRPRYTPASRYRRSPFRARPHLGRRLFRGFLQALGIAYLAHLLFGWGGGGSPLGLMLLVGIVFWMVTRAIRRRRPPALARGWPSVPSLLGAFSPRQQLGLAAVALAAAASGVMHYAGVDGRIVFPMVTIPLAGLAWLVSVGTDALGNHVGPGLTGVLQSTLGNLPELFVVIFALKAGEVVVAQTSILGSLFANALLVLGLVIVFGARASEGTVMRFHPRLPNDTATLLLLASFLIVLLGLSVSSHDKAASHAVTISAAGAIVLLIVYATWLWSYLHADIERPESEQEAGDAPPLSLRTALVLLGVAGVGAAFVSDWFIASLNPAIEALHLSKAFAGIVIVAIAGNAVENVAGISLAAKGKMDDAISVVKNSVAQIAAFLFPALVLISLLFETHLTFVLAPVYIGAVLLTALSVWQITGDGEATIPEGAALVGIFVILAFLTFYE